MTFRLSRMKPLLVLASLAVLAAALSGCSSVPDQLTPAETLEAKNDGALIVDIRESEGFEQFHIPGSVNIPLDELTSRLDEIPRDQHVILVCALGRTSYAARDILLERGYTSISSMLGGMTAWYDSGYPGIFSQ